MRTQAVPQKTEQAVRIARRGRRRGGGGALVRGQPGVDFESS